MNINFTHEYDKLKDRCFTTFRSLWFCRDLRLGQKVDVFVKGEYRFSCQIISMRITEISKIFIDTIMLDTRFGNHVCVTHEEFISFLNTFRRFNKIKSADEELVELTLRRE